MTHIIQVQARSPEWYDLRKKYVGASEVAALFGESSYTTKLELWLIKSGKSEGDSGDSDRAYWGRMLEDAIAAGVAEREGWEIDNTEAFYVHADLPGMGCTPDRLIVNHPKGLGVLEIKNVDYIEYKRNWLDDEPPVKYLLQLQHQIACTGATWGAIGALIGGNTLEVFTYERHDKSIKKIEAAITEFWQSVRDDVQPASAGADDYEVIRSLFRQGGGAEVDLGKDNELPILCAVAKEAEEKRKAAEKEEKATKARIIEKIGNADAAKACGFYLTYKMITKNMSAKPAHIQQYRQLTIKELSA